MLMTTRKYRVSGLHGEIISNSASPRVLCKDSGPNLRAESTVDNIPYSDQNSSERGGGEGSMDNLS